MKIRVHLSEEQEEFDEEPEPGNGGGERAGALRRGDPRAQRRQHPRRTGGEPEAAEGSLLKGAARPPCSPRPPISGCRKSNPASPSTAACSRNEGLSPPAPSWRAAARSARPGGIRGRQAGHSRGRGGRPARPAHRAEGGPFCRGRRAGGLRLQVAARRSACCRPTSATR